MISQKISKNENLKFAFLLYFGNFIWRQKRLFNEQLCCNISLLFRKKYIGVVWNFLYLPVLSVDVCDGFPGEHGWSVCGSIAKPQVIRLKPLFQGTENWAPKEWFLRLILILFISFLKGLENFHFFPVNLKLSELLLFSKI